MKIHLAARALAVVALLSSPLVAAEPLSLASLLTDHAVLQRDMPVPVWGKAEPGREVVVQFAGQEKRSTADKDGRWMVKLDPLKASAEGQTLTVKTDADDPPITRDDVLVGEVWVCSGQSNMAWNLGSASNGPEAIAVRPATLGCGCSRRERTPPTNPKKPSAASWAVDSPRQRRRFFGRGLLLWARAAPGAGRAGRLDPVGRRRHGCRSVDAAGRAGKPTRCSSRCWTSKPSASPTIRSNWKIDKRASPSCWPSRKRRWPRPKPPAPASRASRSRRKIPASTTIVRPACTTARSPRSCPTRFAERSGIRANRTPAAARSIRRCFRP